MRRLLILAIAVPLIGIILGLTALISNPPRTSAAQCECSPPCQPNQHCCQNPAGGCSCGIAACN